MQKILMGTHGDEVNQVQIHKIRMPAAGSAVNNKVMSMERKERFVIDHELNHAGEVNKARYMPQSHNLIATKTTSGEVHLFDYFKHPTKPLDADVHPNLRLLGHTSEGYGLSWNPLREGLLLSGSDDGIICLWDINQVSKVEVDPVYQVHNSHDGEEVEDVAWSQYDEGQYVSVGDDKRVNVWDMRKQGEAMSVEEAHQQEIMCVDTSPFDPCLILTGSMDCSAALWDLRNMQQPLFKFLFHKDHLTQCKFSPLQPQLLATSSADNLVCLWDLAQINDENDEAKNTTGMPNELKFVHAGHQAKVSDIAWNQNEKMTMASVSEDNVVQVWSVA